MQIGKLAALTGVSIRMLRYYESAGLLHPARTESGYRCFTSQDVAMVKRIRVLNQAGFTLPVIRGVLNCVHSEQAPCEALKIKMRQQRDDIDRQINALYESRDLLDRLLLS